MRGPLRERKPGVWELRVLRGKDPLTGKYVYVSRTIRGGKRVAERALSELLAENQGPASRIPPQPAPPPIGSRSSS